MTAVQLSLHSFQETKSNSNVLCEMGEIAIIIQLFNILGKLTNSLNVNIIINLLKLRERAKNSPSEMSVLPRGSNRLKFYFSGLLSICIFCMFYYKVVLETLISSNVSDIFYINVL